MTCAIALQVRTETMTSLIEWFASADNALAVLVTIGVAVLLVCCLECTDCRHREDDDIFRHHQV